MKKIVIAMLLSDKIDFKAKSIMEGNRGLLQNDKRFGRFVYTKKILK